MLGEASESASRPRDDRRPKLEERAPRPEALLGSAVREGELLKARREVSGSSRWRQAWQMEEVNARGAFIVVVAIICDGMHS